MVKRMPNRTAVQYDLVIEYLQERYSDTEFIIHHHYDNLSTLSQSTNTTQE